MRAQMISASSRLKTTRSRYVDGSNATTMISTPPRMKAPIMAPRTLPMPPTTAAMKAFQPTRIPMYGIDDGVGEAVHRARGAREPRTDRERDRDDQVHRNAHQRHVGLVPGNRAHRHAHRSAMHDVVEHEHQEHRQSDDDQLQRGDREAPQVPRHVVEQSSARSAGTGKTRASGSRGKGRHRAR